MVAFSEAQLLAWITPLLWPLLRTLALLSAMPVFNQKSVPARIKVALALFVALAAQPSLPAMVPVPLDSPAAVALVAQQVVVGVLMGFAVRVVFAAFEAAGEIVGLQMGLNFAGFFDPVSASQGTATARLYGTLVGFMFVLGGGHALMIQAVAHSFEVFRVGDAPLDALRRLAPWTWAREMFVLGAWLATPLVAMLLFVNLVLGVVSRVAPQLNVFSIGFPITLSLGLAGLLLTLPLLQSPFDAAIGRMAALFG